jgi:hypothetical protein
VVKMEEERRGGGKGRDMVMEDEEKREIREK